MKKFSKGFSPVLILLVLSLLVVGSSCAFYYLMMKKGGSKNVSDPTPIELEKGSQNKNTEDVYDISTSVETATPEGSPVSK